MGCSASVSVMPNYSNSPNIGPALNVIIEENTYISSNNSHREISPMNFNQPNKNKSSFKVFNPYAVNP